MQKKPLGNLVAVFTTEVGNVNEIVHIWACEDLAEGRAATAAGPAWQAYLQKSRE